ncbi:NUDIX hydrolase domain-like [Lasallia pustulata]|uniref:NUDIX hydrolase domain-like n=1 Tax=Lasallia pustulata TaxID=136370 RepID=A0A1W5CSU7_9LECA|nr:NUDIX hydrolase domain-like [Lasallia pustulata]
MRADTSGTKRLSNNGLRDVLHHLHEHTYPQVSNPPDCKKRASVALVIRLRPDASYWPCRSGTDSTPSSSFEDRLNGFFDQAWVQHADPEVLFIKRAARTGDRWTSHVALPGGKREPADSSDWATGARETLEEVGLDLNAGFCLPVGNLPERIVTTSWGKAHGIVADFLEMLPPHNALDLWTWPTFSPWDVRLVLWIMSYSFRMRKLRQIGVDQVHAPAAVEEGAEAIDAPKGKPPEVRPGEVGIGGLGAGQLYSKLKQSHERGRSSAVGIMLEGYYDLVRRAVFVALVLRVATGLAMSSLFIKRFRRH